LADRSSELVFAFAYPVGASVDHVITTFEKILRQYGYDSHQYRISDHLPKMNLKTSFADSSAHGRSDALMKAGNEARSIAKHDGILAVMAVESIGSLRSSDESERPIAMPRTAHLVRSLKRPEEVSLLREIYRSGFYLVGIANDDDSQEKYLTKVCGMSSEQAKGLMERDRDEDTEHGQRTRQTFYLSDVFIDADDDHYEDQIDRFLELVFGHPFITPRRHEHAMFLAYASAARSAEPGRQVGAAIATPDGDILAVGMNEVPSPKGGVYWDGDEEDHRAYTKEIDSNAAHRNMIATDIVDKLVKSKVLDTQKLREILGSVFEQSGVAIPDKFEERVQGMLDGESGIFNVESVMTAINKSSFRSITEFGRAVHGEMDAILTCARLGISVRGNDLFVTTFPCHNCTRHIIASGIRRVFYVEPYPKSKARDLHDDAICFDEVDAKKTGRIPFLPFVGIGPRRYLDFFSLELSSGGPVKRKGDDEKPCRPNKDGRVPRVFLDPDSYLDNEERLRKNFDPVLQVLQSKQSPGDEDKLRVPGK
jgi:deoxycytidylate deaminase